MALKIWKPVTPGRRGMIGIDYSEISKIKPLKSAIKGRKESAGRNNTGKITVRHRGGGNKKLLRDVDFNRTYRKDVEAIVKAIEYDPNRTAFIARICYTDGQWCYILAHEGMKVGDRIICSDKAKPVPGNRLQIQNVPVGYMVFNVEIYPNKGGVIAKSAGSSVKVVSTEGDMAQIQLPSGQLRHLDKTCFVTVGQVSNIDHMNTVLGKAGRVRWVRRKPVVRGKAMNPCDHPHGGGEGRNSIGLKYPKTLWGAHAIGVKTRKRNKYSDYLILDKKKKK